MLRLFKIGLAVALAVLLSLVALAQKRLFAAEAKDHFGESATVCGQVASTQYAASSKGQPTFLNLDKPYPNQIFTVVIWGDNRSKFGTPESGYKGKNICVSGKITAYAGLPEIVVDDPKQIRIE
jgi:DNA/RNA endonuclease YhcR with UshA esterase domain